MLGCATPLRIRCRRLISSGTTCASRVVSTTTLPSKRVTLRPSSCRSRSARSGATTSTSGGTAEAASPSVNARLSVTACAARSTLRLRRVASVRA